MPASLRDLNAYLLQLEEEGFVTPLADDWLLPWEQMYEILDAPDHETSIPLLTLPDQSDLRPVLSSSASLADLRLQDHHRGLGNRPWCADSRRVGPYRCDVYL
jgi:hypothetical protein